MGNNWPHGNGPNPVRSAMILSGLPVSVPAHTVNKACPAGLKALLLASQAIRLGDSQIVVTGGMESMSNIPHLLKGARWSGFRTGEIVIIDAFFSEGDPILGGLRPGEMAEHTAEKNGITREEQDRFGLESHLKAAKAWEEGRYDDEVMPIEIPPTKDKPSFIFAKDECFRPDASVEAMAKLATPFKKGGTVTAGTSSGVTDGAAAMVVTSRQNAKELGLKPLASIYSYASVALAPIDMLEGPIYAIPKVLQKAGMTLDDMDLIEINEAFAAAVLTAIKVLKIDELKLNVHGGAIALGHPTGFSGGRIPITLINALRQRGKEFGLIAICGGGGLGVAGILSIEA